MLKDSIECKKKILTRMDGMKRKRTKIKLTTDHTEHTEKKNDRRFLTEITW